MRAEEGRGKATKRRGELSSELRSVATRMGQPGPCDDGSPLAEHIGQEEASGGTETSQYPEEKRAFPK
jgi:hypothetical protein